MTLKVSEIDDYLSLPVENVIEPLKWWVDKCHIYPNLSQMACDYLSIPGESCRYLRNIFVLKSMCY
jgi:hypothetical protein